MPWCRGLCPSFMLDAEDARGVVLKERSALDVIRV